jgi:hypothetical protein
MDFMKGHSPIIVWLLAAATLCVDMIALRWSHATSYIDYADVAFFALLAGQLSVVCIWAALRRDSSLWTHAAPVLAAVAAAVAFKHTRFLDFAAYFGMQSATVVIAMWIFRRSRYWQQRSGIETVWQFSISQLLMVMTVVALLMVGFQISSLWNDGGDDAASFFGYVGCSTVLAVAAVYTWSKPVHWLLRLAAVLAVALGLATMFLIGDTFMFAFAAGHFVIEGLVLSVWLTWGQILPLNEAYDVAEMPM